MTRILGYFHERGFYAADVYFSIAVEDEQRTVTFHIDRGEPVEVMVPESRALDCAGGRDS